MKFINVSSAITQFCLLGDDDDDDDDDDDAVR